LGARPDRYTKPGPLPLPKYPRLCLARKECETNTTCSVPACAVPAPRSRAVALNPSIAQAEPLSIMAS
jgi:hypothetical protein